MCVHRFPLCPTIFIYSCAHKCTCPLQNMQIVVNFNKIGWIMKIPYYCLFNNTLNNLPQELLIQFYSAIMESVLCISITAWFSSATKSDLRRLRRVVRTAERIIGTTLPTLQELYSSRLSKRTGKITLDPSHQAHSLFELLPSGQRYRALSTRTTRHRNSFFPQAIHLMNT